MLSTLRNLLIRQITVLIITLLALSLVSCGKSDWVVSTFPEKIEIMEVLGACSEAPIIDGYQAGLVKIGTEAVEAINRDGLVYFNDANESRSGQWQYEHWRQNPLLGDARSDEAKTELGYRIWVRPVAGCYTREKPDWAKSEDMDSLLKSYTEGRSFFTVERSGYVMLVIDPDMGLGAYFFLNP